MTDGLTVAALFVGIIALLVSIAGTVVALLTLLPVLRQQRLDTRDPWPFDIVPIGSTFDTLIPDLPVLKVKFGNRSTRTAYFMLDCGSSEPGFGFYRPHRVTIWPTGQSWGLYLELPPRVWREVRITPFSWTQKQPPTWTFHVWEFYHGAGSPKEFRWPEDLKNPLDEPAQYLPEPYLMP